MISRILARTVVAVACTLVGAAGCGLHLHRPNDAKQARSATDSFNELKLDAALTTARANVATLTRAEIETRQKMGEVLVRRDALSVVAFAPAKPSDQSEARGWRKLVKETGDALRKYGVVTGDPPQLVGNNASQLHLITQRADNLVDLALERRVHESLVKTYKLPGKPATQQTDCDKVPKPEDLGPAPALPSGEDPERWQHYRDHIVTACHRVRVAKQKVDAAEELLRGDPDYRKLAEQIDTFSNELRGGEAKVREVTEAYAKAKKALADAEQELAKAATKERSEEQRKKIESLKADIAKATEALTKVVDTSKDVPVLAAAVKSDLLSDVVANAKSLSGDSTAPAHKVTKALAKALDRFPDVAERFRAAASPPVNVYILELALQRLEYRKLIEERAAKTDVVTILQAKREALIEAAAAWGLVMETLNRPEKNFPLALRQRLESTKVSEVLGNAGDPGVGFARKAVIDYLKAKLIEDVDLPTFDLRAADRYYRMSLDFSEVALEARNDLVRAPLQEITAYHESGIRSEELAALLQAVGVAGIAAGVNK